jgi:hypothetical protein
MRRSSAVVVALLFAFAAPASAVESTIYPGVGIGKVKLGMTEAQVKKALGSWRYVNERKGDHLSVGWGFAEWTIDFIRGRTVQVSTTIHSQRTASGIGTGSSWRALLRAYPRGTCAWYGAAVGHPGPVEYLVTSKSGTQTIFFLRYPQEALRNPAAARWTVTEVKVRTRFEQLPEFGTAWEPKCKSDWRTSDVPL